MRYTIRERVLWRLAWWYNFFGKKDKAHFLRDVVRYSIEHRR